MSETNTGAPAPAAEPSSTPNESMESMESQEESLDSAAEVPAMTKAEIKKTIKQLKLKVDGKEYAEDLPFELPDDPKAIEYMQRQLQMGKMGQNRAKQYSDLESEVRGYIELLKSNPRKALSDPTLGIDLKAFAASIIEEEIENSRKSPEQLEKEAMAAELAEIKKEREAEREARKKQEFESLQKQEYERYQNGINSAIEQSGLPKSAYLTKKTAEYMMLAINEGIDVKPEDVIPLVKKDLNNDLKELFGSMNEDLIEEYVGKDNLARVRKRNLAKAKEKPVLPGNKIAKDIGSSKASEKKIEEQKKTLREFFDV
jgi:hypothetical protein